MVKKRAIATILLLALVSFLAWYVFFAKAPPTEVTSISGENSPPAKEKLFKNEEEHIAGFNESIRKSAEAGKRYREYLKTREGKAKSEAYWKRMYELAQGQLDEITFYGQVVDQHGIPVSNALVHYNATSGYLTSSTGHQRIYTDDKGIFIIDGANGAALHIVEISRDGYEVKLGQSIFDNYKRFPDSVLWADYSNRSKPYVYRAWKVSEKGYPNVATANGSYGFEPGQVYSLDFTANHKARVKKKGALNLDLEVLFEKDGADNWSLSLKVPDGGLVEAEGRYPNIAPEVGYRQTLSFSGTYQEFEESGRSPKVARYFIYSRGKYGRIDIEISPYAKPFGSGMGIKHVLNLDGGRNLEVR